MASGRNISERMKSEDRENGTNYMSFMALEDRAKMDLFDIE